MSCPSKPGYSNCCNQINLIIQTIQILNICLLIIISSSTKTDVELSGFLPLILNAGKIKKSFLTFYVPVGRYLNKVLFSSFLLAF